MPCLLPHSSSHRWQEREPCLPTRDTHGDFSLPLDTGTTSVWAATLDEVTKKKPAELSAEQQVAAELVRKARERGLSLTGQDGLLKQLTKSDSS